MGGVDEVEEKIAALADVIWRGEDARHELHKLLRENPGRPGPTRVAELTEYLYRPEHVSRIAHSEPPKRRKQRRRAVGES
jgi:hypothetical protein